MQTKSLREFPQDTTKNAKSMKQWGNAGDASFFLDTSSFFLFVLFVADQHFVTTVLPRTSIDSKAQTVELPTEEERQTKMMMKKQCQCKAVFPFVALVMALLVLPATAAEIPDKLPDPDGKPADQSKPVQVFILMGQSNMLGFGRVGAEDQKGTLEHLTKKEGKYPHLIDEEGNWTVRNDVQYVQTTVGNRQHPLTIQGRHIGVEVQFGHIMGHIHDEPVLILKACIGNRSLGWDLLPPGGGQFEYDGRIYAGYKESPLSWEKGTEPQPIA